MSGSERAPDPFRAIQSEMAERVRHFDWTTTPLGPIPAWPQSLKTAVSTVLLSPVPIVMLWGEDGIMIYNDGYSEFAGQRHPSLLGSKVREGWPEVADFNDNIMKVGLAGGTLAYRDFVLNLNRTGTFEPVWLDLDYSPILDDDGKPAGVMAIVIEITKRVIAEKKVRDEHERMAQMFAQAPSFMSQMDGPTHVFTLTNDAYQQLIGHRDVIGKTVREALPELEGQGFYELLDDVYRTGEPFVGRASPVVLKRKPDAAPEHVLLDFIYQPIKAADGSVTGIFVEGFDVTDERTAQQALRLSEERLRLATENAGVGLWDIDPEGGIDFSYSRRSSSFIMDRENRVPMAHLLSRLHPEDAPRLEANYEAARDPAQRALMDVEYRVLPEEGQPMRWVKIRGRGVFDAGGNLLRISGTALDISKEREAEEALRRSEEQFRLATEHAEVGMWDVDNVANTLTWSRQVRAAFGVDPDVPVTLEDFYNGLHPDDREATSIAFADANDPKKRALYDVEYRTVGKNHGVIRWVHAKGRGVFDDNGVCIRVTGTALDITRRKEAEEKLRRSEEQLRLASDNAEIGLWDMDVLHNVAYSTPRVKTMFGMPADSDPAPDEFFALVHPEDIARVQEGYAAAFDPVKRASYDIEYRVTGRDDGVLRWIHAKGRGVFDANGVLLRVTGTATDITAIKQQQARGTLLAELSERLREIENPDDISYAAAELLGRGLGVSRAGYGTIDPHAETITIARDWNAPGVKSLAGTLQFRDYGSYIEDLKRGKTVVFADAEKERVANAEALKSIGAVSLVNMPVTEQAGLVALLYLNNETPREWSDEDLELIREAAERTRVAVERRTAEAELRRSEEQLRLATEYADVGLWDIDLVNDIVYWPARVNEMFGFAPGVPVTMKEFRAAIHPKDKRRTIERILEACDPQKRTFYDVEYRIIRRNDGAVRWVSAKGRAVFDDKGVCARMLGVILDITDRKEIEEQARESEARFRTLFESIDDGFCIIEAIETDGTVRDFRYVEENPALAARSGITGALGHTIREMLPTEADGWIDILAKVLTTGEPMRFERFLETTKRLLELYVLRIDPRERGQVAVLFQDITDRRAQEMRLHELNETLEKRVIERTAALERSQAALQQAQKMEAIGNLTGGIAHDFNNLLQGVAGSLDLIRRKADDAAKVKRWAEAGLEAAERGAKLTAQLLAFSRSQKLELKPLNVPALLEGMRDLLGRTLGPAVRVTLDLPKDAASVLGDETQLEMAVLNLAINARDAMADGGDLTIRAGKREIKNDAQLSPGTYVEIAVSDTGSGMPPDVAARAFDPFFTTKGVGKGTGLGLSQVYGMAQQAGGIARISSQPGQGTTVSILLRETYARRPDEKAQEDDDARAIAPATVLVVDDDPGVRRFLQDSLDAFGYVVLEAADGSAGLDLLERAKPDLLIVDYAMPGMTGAEVAQKARARFPDLPIIFASGYAETAALENVADANTRILRKPFRVGELQDAMVKALNRSLS